MTDIERLYRIAKLQDEIDALIESCDDGECCPCPTCAALEDAGLALIVARGRAAWMVQPESECA